MHIQDTHIAAETGNLKSMFTLTSLPFPLHSLFGGITFDLAKLAQLPGTYVCFPGAYDST